MSSEERDLHFKIDSEQRRIEELKQTVLATSSKIERVRIAKWFSLTNFWLKKYSVIHFDYITLIFLLMLNSIFFFNYPLIEKKG